MTAEAIDKDPLSLLPANPVVLFWADAPAFFASTFGNQITRILAARLPIADDAGFVPPRDLRAIVGGIYSMAGADAVVALSGDFHPELIRKAVEKQTVTPVGTPIVISQYAGNDLYTSKNIGFTVVTTKTILAGNETGIRRALDRIRDNRVKREAPEWMMRLVETPQASLVVAGDLTSQPQVAALANQAPFLNSVQKFRVLGNFLPPGLNVAGSLSYPDAATAAQAGASMQELARRATLLSALSFLGLGAPVQGVQVEVRESDAQFVLGLDAQAVAQVLSML